MRRVDCQTNALPNRPIYQPTNRPTNGHSQLKRCFVAPKNEKSFISFCFPMEIQASKLAARGGTFVEYKIRKSKSGIITRLRKEEGLPEAFT